MGVGDREATARPLTARGAATRARILDAAGDLMCARGVAATSLDDVMAVSATSKSQLYHYFADKDDLVRAVIVLQTERVLGAQQPFLDHLDSPAALRQWAAALVSAQRNAGGGCPVGSMAAELSDSSEAARTILVDSFQEWQSPIVSGLQAMLDRGELDAGADPVALGTSVMAAVQGGLLLAKTTRSSRPLELALDMALTYIGVHVRSDPPDR